MRTFLIATVVVQALAFEPASAEAVCGSAAHPCKTVCHGTIIRDTCGGTGANAGGPCGNHPTWRKGDRPDLMAWAIENGERVYIQYRIGAIPARDIKLPPDCERKLPRYCSAEAGECF